MVDSETILDKTNDNVNDLWANVVCSCRLQPMFINLYNVPHDHVISHNNFQCYINTYYCRLFLTKERQFSDTLFIFMLEYLMQHHLILKTLGNALSKKQHTYTVGNKKNEIETFFC